MRGPIGRCLRQPAVSIMTMKTRGPENLMEDIPFDSATRLAVMTGAGISAESGVITFREKGGLW